MRPGWFQPVLLAPVKLTAENIKETKGWRGRLAGLQSPTVVGSRDEKEGPDS